MCVCCCIGRPPEQKLDPQRAFQRWAELWLQPFPGPIVPLFYRKRWECVCACVCEEGWGAGFCLFGLVEVCWAVVTAVSQEVAVMCQVSCRSSSPLMGR